MATDYYLMPDLEWLATTRDGDETWLGPGPALINLRQWMERLSGIGHRNLVIATHSAASAACQHWDHWLSRSRELALESILESRPPDQQLAAVARWLDSPTSENKSRAIETVDLTKQLHWFHEEYRDAWFDEPGMWAVESSEYCVLSLTGDPYSRTSLADLATIAVSCAVNSFRMSAEGEIHDSLSIIVDAIRLELEQIP
jgi:hypothetical protein